MICVFERRSTAVGCCCPTFTFRSSQQKRQLWYRRPHNRTDRGRGHPSKEEEEWGVGRSDGVGRVGGWLLLQSRGVDGEVGGAPGANDGMAIGMLLMVSFGCANGHQY